ncbi:MAG: hypothetical protein QM713_10440 [Arachnia sp.]
MSNQQWSPGPGRDEWARPEPAPQDWGQPAQDHSAWERPRPDAAPAAPQPGDGAWAPPAPAGQEWGAPPPPPHPAQPIPPQPIPPQPIPPQLGAPDAGQPQVYAVPYPALAPTPPRTRHPLLDLTFSKLALPTSAALIFGIGALGLLAEWLFGFLELFATGSSYIGVSATKVLAHLVGGGGALVAKVLVLRVLVEIGVAVTKPRTEPADEG